jgi:hypothetical protein
MTIAYDRSWRFMDDADLRSALTMHRRALALVDQENPDPDIRESTRQFLSMLVTDGEAEEARRKWAERLGVPRDAERFAAGWLADLKSSVMLDTLLEHDAGARLGPERHGKRRGSCPFCKPSEQSDCFVVFTADPADQWYYCHRCGAAGDCFVAVMQCWGGRFVNAVEHLAHQRGVPLPARSAKLHAAPASAATNGNGRRPLPIRRNKGN